MKRIGLGLMLLALGGAGCSLTEPFGRRPPEPPPQVETPPPPPPPPVKPETVNEQNAAVVAQKLEAEIKSDTGKKADSPTEAPEQ